MILLITNKFDLTSDFLALRLKERAIPFFRINTEDILDKLNIDISLSNFSDKSEFNYGDRIIDFDEIKSVYYRRPELPDLYDKILFEEIDFAQREIETLLSGAWKLIDMKKWLNHPTNNYNASNKIEQLKIAKEIDFNIPKTLITKNLNKINSFFETNHPVIIKALKHGFYAKNNKIKIALTQEIHKSDIEEMNSFAQLPSIYQEKLDKQVDIRVTVIGNKVFPVALFSQDHIESKTDWRAWDLVDYFDLKHEKIILPEDIIQKCIAITKFYNLNFSAIDMVLTKDDKYIFLELNPNGQWAWIEKKVNYPLRDAIIDFLI